MDEQQRRRIFAGFQKIDPVALARAVAQVEMSGMPLAQFRGALLPAGDHLGAAGNRDAVVEAEVAVLLAHAAPVRRVEWRRHPSISFQPVAGVSTLRKMFYSTITIRYHEAERTGECAWLIIRDWFGKRPAPSSTN